MQGWVVIIVGAECVWLKGFHWVSSNLEPVNGVLNVHKECTFDHHLLTLILSQPCIMNIFCLSWSIKEILSRWSNLLFSTHLKWWLISPPSSYKVHKKSNILYFLSNKLHWVKIAPLREKNALVHKSHSNIAFRKNTLANKTMFAHYKH